MELYLHPLHAFVTGTGTCVTQWYSFSNKQCHSSFKSTHHLTDFLLMSALHNPVRTMKCLINKTISGFANHSRIVTGSAVSRKCSHHLRGDFSSHMPSPQWCTLLDMTAFPRSGRLVVKTVRFTITARVSIELAIMLFYHTVHRLRRAVPI